MTHTNCAEKLDTRTEGRKLARKQPDAQHNHTHTHAITVNILKVITVDG